MRGTVARQLQLLALLLFLTLLAGCRAPRAAGVIEPPLTDDGRAHTLRSFDVVWERVNTSYFKPDRLQPGEKNVDWAAVRDELRPKITSARNMSEARAVLNAMLARLGETHFGVLPGDVYEATAATTGAATTGPAGEVGITLRLLGDRAIVYRVAPGSSAARAGVRPGWILLDVNGRPLAPLIATLRRQLPDTRLSEVKVLHRVHDELAVPLGGQARVTFYDGRDRRRRLSLVGGDADGEMALLGNLPPMSLRVDDRTLDGNVGYFALSIFLNPPRVMPAFDAFVKRHPGATGLVIDLRGNPGGIGSMASGMCGYFVHNTAGGDAPKLGTMITRSDRLNFVINPRYPRFTGPLAILVDGQSMSTSEILAAGLQDLKRARIFGQPTPGAALPSTVERLPNGDRFQFAVADYISAGGKRLEGVGVTPDEVVPLDRASLLAGRDATLDAALAWIRSQQQPATATAPATQPDQR